MSAWEANSTEANLCSFALFWYEMDTAYHGFCKFASCSETQADSLRFESALSTVIEHRE